MISTLLDEQKQQGKLADLWCLASLPRKKNFMVEEGRPALKETQDWKEESVGVPCHNACTSMYIVSTY